MKTAQRRKYYSWAKLIEDIKKNSDDTKIYRGQSNDYKTIPPKEFLLPGLPKELPKNRTAFWPLISSFDRIYKARQYRFSIFLSQQLENNCFNARYRNYPYSNIKHLSNCGQLERIYYLQHYGVPTCFLDFSKNFLVALYFGISSVKANSTSTCDSNENPVFYPNSQIFISIFEINHKRIHELLNVKYLENDFSFMEYGKYKIAPNRYLAFDLTPIEKCQDKVFNYNLIHQDGCFVLFDNGGTKVTLDKFIEDKLNDSKDVSEPVIRIYQLDYNAIFRKEDIDEYKNIGLFKYLDLNGKTGRTLFNDIQGLKYDLNFFHQS